MSSTRPSRTARVVTERQINNLPPQLTYWAYCGLDCCVTREVFDVIHARLTPVTEKTYAFERACQSPAMAMMRRGILVDEAARSAAITQCGRDLRREVGALNKLALVRDYWDGTELETGHCLKSTRKDGRHKWPKVAPGAAPEDRQCECCGTSRAKPKPFNPTSHNQTARLFHDLHGVPRQMNKKREYSVDEEVLERIGRKWPRFEPLTGGLLGCRGLAKQLGFLRSRLSGDGRMRFSCNVGAPETGRWSSSKNPYKEGTNIQNIAEKNRHIFIPDPGYELGYADLEQAESRGVAYDSGDRAYIEAHESGDVHTFVCRMLWPDLPWTGDLARDQIIARTAAPFDPDHDYRFNAKRCQHGLNYMLMPQGLAAWAHIPLAEAKAVYDQYFYLFPGIRAWHKRLAHEVRETGVLTSPLGRRRQFFGRLWDTHTIRQAIAFIPQSLVADVLNVALWRVWRDLDPAPVQLLAQVHDAILFQVPRGAEGDEATTALVERMLVPVEMHGGTMTIPVEVLRGGNWGKRNTDPKKGPLNPHGMEKWPRPHGARVG